MITVTDVADQVVSAFKTLDDGTATDTRHKEKLLDIAFAVVQFVQSRNYQEEMEKRYPLQRYPSVPVSEVVKKQIATIVEPGPEIMAGVLAPEQAAAESPEVVEAPKKSESKRLKALKEANDQVNAKTTAQLIEEDKREEEAPF